MFEASTKGSTTIMQQIERQGSEMSGRIDEDEQWK